MRRRAWVVSVVLAVASVASCPLREAHAQQLDGPRFRGGIGVEGGGMIVPSFGSFGALHPFRVELGVQINDRWGLYLVPSLGLFTGGQAGDSGMTAGVSVLFDYTFALAPISLGVGPDFTFITCFSCQSIPQGTDLGGTEIGGNLYGGRARIAFHPVLSHRPGDRRRHALTLGVDLQVQTSSSPFAYDTNNMGNPSSTSRIAISPTASLGYTAF